MDTSTNLGLALVGTSAGSGVMIALAILGALIHRIATRLESEGDF